MGAGMVVVGCGGRVRKAVLRRLLTTRGREVRAPAWPMQRLLRFAVEARANVIVVDGCLAADSLRAISGAVETWPELGVLVVGPLTPNLEVLLALASGARGYVPAQSAPEVLADAVDALDAGEMVVPRAIWPPLVAHLRDGGRGITVERGDGRTVELSCREWEVLVLVRQGYSTAEMAERLVVSRVTVRTHVAALVHKLGVTDRAALSAPRASPGEGEDQRDAVLHTPPGPS
jgi:DNA-binding NarL/FixJ family response regulator